MMPLQLRSLHSQLSQQQCTCVVLLQAGTRVVPAAAVCRRPWAVLMLLPAAVTPPQALPGCGALPGHFWLPRAAECARMTSAAPLGRRERRPIGTALATARSGRRSAARAAPELDLALSGRWMCGCGRIAAVLPKSCAAWGVARMAGDPRFRTDILTNQRLSKRSSGPSVELVSDVSGRQLVK